MISFGDKSGRCWAMGMQVVNEDQLSSVGWPKLVIGGRCTKRRVAASIIPFSALVMAGCDSSFEPIEPSDFHYSIVGYLDASADTQWIRIMPLREQVRHTTAEPLNAVVTLKNLTTGTSVVLRDSVFAYPSAAFLESGETTYAHNFWTIWKIIQGHRYELKVARNDGAMSLARVTVPAEFPVTIEYLQTDNSAIVEVPVEFMGPVTLRLYTLGVRDGCPFWPYWDHPWKVPPRNSGSYRTPIQFNVRVGSCQVWKRTIFLVVADREWPAATENAAWAFQNLGGRSDFTDAVGFFVGVVSKELPWESCVLTPQPGPCRLTYSVQSATLMGRVTDAMCGVPASGGSDQGPTVELRDLVSGQDTPARLRSVSVGKSGYFRFDAVDPERPYSLRVSYPSARTLQTPSVDIYESREDHIVVGTGETVIHDVSLQRLVPC